MTDSSAPSDPELIRFLREELGEDAPPGGGSWQHTAPMWLWRGQGKDGQPTSTAWHFVTIDGDVAEGIRAASPGHMAAWGSVYVQVTIGQTSWRTSLFPSKNVKGYLLPIKASVRKAEKLSEDDVVTVHLTV
ncbi:MAG: DUF1905 domain-containing protein [Sphingomonadales bacterium]